jgi:hypothetical protein
MKCVRTVWRGFLRDGSCARRSALILAIVGWVVLVPSAVHAAFFESVTDCIYQSGDGSEDEACALFTRDVCISNNTCAWDTGAGACRSQFYASCVATCLGADATNHCFISGSARQISYDDRQCVTPDGPCLNVFGDDVGIFRQVYEGHGQGMDGILSRLLRAYHFKASHHTSSIEILRTSCCDFSAFPEDDAQLRDVIGNLFFCHRNVTNDVDIRANQSYGVYAGYYSYNPWLDFYVENDPHAPPPYPGDNMMITETVISCADVKATDKRYACRPTESSPVKGTALQS